MSLNAPLGAAPEGGALEVTAATSLIDSGRTLRRRRAHTRSREERIGIAATLGVPLMGLLLSAAGTQGGSLAPGSISQDPAASGMAGPLAYIGFRLTVGEVVAALLVILGMYLVAMRYCDHVPPRLIVGAIVAFIVIAVLGPPLFSTDVFSYQAYAQMFAHYHINPYLHGPSVIGSYPLYNPMSQYIGAKWIQTPSVYGPLFTFLSVVFQSTSIPFNYWAFKVIAALACGGTLYLIWRAAQRRGVSPKHGVALFGLNPLVTLCGVGGGHNDLLMMLLTTAGLYALLTRRDRSAGTLLAAATAIKLTGVIVAPFALIGEASGADSRTRGKRILSTGLAFGAVVAAASYIAFGTGVLHMFHTLQSVQNEGAWQSLPGFLFSLPRLSVTPAVRIANDVVLGAVLLWLVRRVWQARMDWVDGAAWATFAVLATAWSLLPWYSAWLMPLVALSTSRRLWHTATVVTVMGGAILIGGCFPTWNWL